MAQNTSSAVMAQRSEAHDSLDDFPTPPWATRAICSRIARDTRLTDLSARDPCAGRGHMVRPLQEYFSEVYAADVHDYGAGIAQRDFLYPGEISMVDWTFINPPFRLAEQFIERAIETSRKGVVCIARTSFLEGERRAAGIFAIHRPDAIYQFAERVVMLKGRLVQAGALDPENLDGDGDMRKASSATAYCALVWHRDRNTGSTWFDWIRKCRADFEVDGDYPSPVYDIARLHRSVLA